METSFLTCGQIFPKFQDDDFKFIQELDALESRKVESVKEQMEALVSEVQELRAAKKILKSQKKMLEKKAKMFKPHLQRMVNKLWTVSIIKSLQSFFFQ